MKWTVSAAKGVRKLSLRCSVIYPWAWSQAVTSFCIRKSFNGVDCDFSANTGPQSSFHRDNITTNMQPAEPLWWHDWRWAIKLNLLRQWETTRTHSRNMPHHDLKNTRAQYWFFSSLDHILSPSQHKENVRRQRRKKKESTRNCARSLQELYLHLVQQSGSSVDKYSHILIFQLAWLLFSKHMQTQQGVY